MPARVLVRRVLLVAQSLLYVAAGINHFWHSQTYVSIMPSHYHHPLGLVQLSGVAEIAGGLGLLLPSTRRFAAWGIVAMLLVYFDVHIFMAMHPERFSGIPQWALYVRLPLQFVLIYWAWSYTKPEPIREAAASNGAGAARTAARFQVQCDTPRTP